jgi:hypothetical protein
VGLSGSRAYFTCRTTLESVFYDIKHYRTQHISEQRLLGFPTVKKQGLASLRASKASQKKKPAEKPNQTTANNKVQERGRQERKTAENLNVRGEA